MKKQSIAIIAGLTMTSAFSQFLLENVRSGTPSWDNAFIRAGGKFEDDPTKVMPTVKSKNTEPKPSEVIFLLENVRSGITSWDEAFIRAGGKFQEYK